MLQSIIVSSPFWMSFMPVHWDSYPRRRNTVGDYVRGKCRRASGQAAEPPAADPSVEIAGKARATLTEHPDKARRLPALGLDRPAPPGGFCVRTGAPAMPRRVGFSRGEV